MCGLQCVMHQVGGANVGVFGVSRVESRMRSEIFKIENEKLITAE